MTIKDIIMSFFSKIFGLKKSTNGKQKLLVPYSELEKLIIDLETQYRERALLTNHIFIKEMNINSQALLTNHRHI
jgi:hypothetical protein